MTSCVYSGEYVFFPRSMKFQIVYELIIYLFPFIDGSLATWYPSALRLPLTHTGIKLFPCS